MKYINNGNIKMKDLKKLLSDTISETKNEKKTKELNQLLEQKKRQEEEKEKSKRTLAEYKKIFKSRPELILNCVKRAIKRDEDYFRIDDGFPKLEELIFMIGIILFVLLKRFLMEF